MIYIGIWLKHIGIALLLIYLSFHIGVTKEDINYLSVGITLYWLGATIADCLKAAKK